MPLTAIYIQMESHVYSPIPGVLWDRNQKVKDWKLTGYFTGGHRGILVPWTSILCHTSTVVGLYQYYYL